MHPEDYSALLEWVSAKEGWERGGRNGVKTMAEKITNLRPAFHVCLSSLIKGYMSIYRGLVQLKPADNPLNNTLRSKGL